MFPIILVVSYLFGSVPFGFVIARLKKGMDIRTVGSGNIGATNVKRVLGWSWAAPVYVLDAVKGILPVWLSMYVFAWPTWQVTLVGVAAVIGHLFPVFLGFKGGKAVSTISGVFFILNPLALEIALPVWLSVYLITKYSSLSALLAAFVFPIVAICQSGAWTNQRLPITILSLAVLAIVLYTHRANIARLLKGEESKV
jgi:glycerol-3-phosphate acyltransferase PlsY